MKTLSSLTLLTLFLGCGIQPVVGVRPSGGGIAGEEDLCDDIQGQVHPSSPDLSFLGPDGDCDDDGIANRIDGCPGVAGAECQYQLENCRAIEQDPMAGTQSRDLRGCHLTLATSAGQTVTLTGNLLCATIQDSGLGTIELHDIQLRRMRVQSAGTLHLRNVTVSESSIAVARYELQRCDIASSHLQGTEGNSTATDSTFRGCEISQQPTTELLCTRTSLENCTLSAGGATESTRLRMRSSTVTGSLVTGFDVDWVNVQTRASEAVIAGGNIASSVLHSSRIQSHGNLLVFGSRVGVGPRVLGNPPPSVVLGPPGDTAAGELHPSQLRVVGGSVHNTRMRGGHIFVQDSSVDQSAIFTGTDFYGIRGAMRTSSFCEATRVHLQSVAIGAGTSCKEPFLPTSCSDSTIVSDGSCRPRDVFPSCGDLHREEPPMHEDTP